MLDALKKSFFSVRVLGDFLANQRAYFLMLLDKSIESSGTKLSFYILFEISID